MNFDFSELSTANAFKLLSSVVVQIGRAHV